MGAEKGTTKVTGARDGQPSRRGNGARERILAAADRLFACQGITATGMEQVAEEAPVSKRTLYAHFRTKSDLVLAHLQALASSGSTLEGVLTRADLDPRERILRLFDAPLAASPPADAPAVDPVAVRGCPFIDAAAEFPDPRNPIHVYAREQKLLMAQLVTELVTELGCAEPGPLAEQLVTLADGAASRAMVLNEPDYGRHARVAAEFLLERALAEAT
ncbi:TetR/AcrR family transcriptional regulator [Streptomyces silvensis]|uniref:TetR family transcriptional regulator n=1 Tax=Streptomyces silvensis TaxID=1765722 RepID=A0A0W7X6Y7_9ACTN|nr:TetR/AcrR family transcriptional regulator [Streptomyces silvensis]KUF18639.1 TetR family transcriptional regulator [Streptomyces silvensis]